MANEDKPNGLRPVRHLNGMPWNGQVERMYVQAAYATKLYVGDAVVSGGSADADGVPDVVQAAAGDVDIIGVITGIEFNPDNLMAVNAPASTAGYVDVCIDPDVIYEIQEDSDTSTLAVTNVGENADIIVGAGNDTTGASGMELDSSSSVATTAQLRILKLVQNPKNAIGANAKWEVMINEHAFKITAGT